MRIIEITALASGAHRNQNGNLTVVPEGWAVIPEEMELPDSFPFVNLVTEGQTVVGMTAGVVPEPEPIPEQTTTEERLQILEESMAALLEGEETE